MNTEIFMPVYQLSMLTFLVWVLILILRGKSIYLDKKHNPDDWVVPRFEGGSNALTYAQRNFTNLLEFPILFYSVCIIIYVTGNVDEYFVELACWFFWLRAVHSIIHIFYNKIIPVIDLPLRSIPWLISVATVVWMWVRIVPML